MQRPASVNRYDGLRIAAPAPDLSPVEASSSWTLTDSRAEVITISSALLPDGSWVYGFCVSWAKGGKSSRLPSAESGRFRSQHDAKLHAVGFMLGYIEHFIPEYQDALRAAEKSLVQLSLFE